MQTLPMLLVRAQAPGILWINGRLAGPLEETLVLPVAPSGEALVQLFPYGPYLPAAVRLQFHRGMALTGQDLFPHALTVWPNGVAALTMHMTGTQAARCVDELSAGEITWYLHKDGGMVLCAEDGQERECFRRVFPQAESGSLRRMAWPAPLSAALLQQEDGQRLLLLEDAGAVPAVVLDVFGQQLRLGAQGESVQSEESLFGGAFTRVRTYRRGAQGFQLASEQVHPAAQELDGEAKRDWSRSAYDRALELVQAVMLGCRDRAEALYGGDLAALTAALGDFDAVESAVLCPMTDSDASIAVLSQTAPGMRCARVFGFDVSEGRVTAFRPYGE